MWECSLEGYITTITSVNVNKLKWNQTIYISSFLYFQTHFFPKPTRNELFEEEQEKEVINKKYIYIPLFSLFTRVPSSKNVGTL